MLDFISFLPFGLLWNNNNNNKNNKNKNNNENNENNKNNSSDDNKKDLTYSNPRFLIFARVKSLRTIDFPSGRGGSFVHLPALIVT